MNVPALRFQSDNGVEYPKWEPKKIGDFVLSHKGGAPLKPKDFEKNGDFEVIPKKAISSGGFLLLDEKEPTYCTDLFFQSNHRSVVDKSYLITTLRDLVPSGPNIGFIVKYSNNKKYILAQGVYGIQINENLRDDFLIQYSNTDKYRELMQTMMVGSTQVHIRNTDFFNTPVHIPSVKEQTKIANFLTAVDEKIQKLNQKHDLLTQYKKGVMQQIFSQELRFKDDDGRDFPDWEEKEIGEVFKVTRGNVLAMPLVSESKTNTHKYPVYSSQTKNNGLSGYYNEYLYENSITWTTDGANAGDVNFRDGKFYCTNVCGVLINKDGHANSCIAAMINAVSRRYVSYVGNPKLMNGVMAKIAIDFPCVKEQTKIANFLTAIDEKITNTQSQLEAVKQYKQGLLQKMFV